VGQHFLVIKFATSELQVPFRTEGGGRGRGADEVA